MATRLSHKTVSVGSLRSTVAKQSILVRPIVCAPRRSIILGACTARNQNNSSSIRQPRTVRALATADSADSEGVAQVPEIMSTVPTQQDKRADIPDHMAADVSTNTQSGGQEESPADRVGSDAAAAEKAPDSDRNQDYDAPLAGEGASAAD